MISWSYNWHYCGSDLKRIEALRLTRSAGGYDSSVLKEVTNCVMFALECSRLGACLNETGMLTHHFLESNCDLGIM
jgi:hypothetical protein